MTVFSLVPFTKERRALHKTICMQSFECFPLTDTQDQTIQVKKLLLNHEHLKPEVCVTCSIISTGFLKFSSF